MPIQLSASTFRRAFVKARTVKPAVVKLDTGYAVKRSDDGLARVRFVARDGAVWASCDCPAHVPFRGPKREPRPCYHIAAAVLWAQTQHAPAPTPVRSHHYHECGGCGLNYPCPCAGCSEIHTFNCDHCDAREADALSWASQWN